MTLYLFDCVFIDLLACLLFSLCLNIYHDYIAEAVDTESGHELCAVLYRIQHTGRSVRNEYQKHR